VLFLLRKGIVNVDHALLHSLTKINICVIIKQTASKGVSI